MAISRKASKADLENYNLDDSIPYMMNRVAGRLNRSLEDDLLKLGITFQHWRVLAVLARGDGIFRPRNAADLNSRHHNLELKFRNKFSHT